MVQNSFFLDHSDQKLFSIFAAMNDARLKAEEDLEFGKIRGCVEQFCFTETGKKRAQDLHLIPNVGSIIFELRCVNEYLDSLRNVSIPSLQSEEILTEIDILESRHGVLHEEQFGNIRQLSRGVNHVLRFFISHEDLFEHIRKRTKDVFITQEIIDAIHHVLDGNCIVKSSASERLAEIRSKLKSYQKQVDRMFQTELSRHTQAGFLHDTRESFINNRKVLAVVSEHKRKIKGKVVGSSGTGRITYIEPEINTGLNDEIAILTQEERDEIYRILKELTAEMKAHLSLIKAYQELLIDFDFLRAKARFAEEVNGAYPIISKKPIVELIDAYHPLLYLENKKRNETTLPQSITLNPDQRIIVISGPNAGGKSITLKTVGLLQMMLQSGLLIPVKEESKVTLFRHILTDIGDNQSIENHLSTYSYRLQNMKQFLKIAGKQTLFLIDEFGTGSDPELGGALAEVFFEELYESEAFGVLTTHYSNIKLIADKLPQALNACMLFDKASLAPLFQLSVGQPGSSFTFEVAQKNGIPHHIIKEAKNRVSEGKLKLDNSIASLQKEKGKIERYQKELKLAKKSAIESEENFDIRREEFEFKLIKLQQTQQDHNEFIVLGKRFKELIEKHNGKNIKQIEDQFTKLLKIEFTKRQEALKKPKQKQTLSSLKKRKEELKQHKKDQPVWLPIVVGDKVKMEGAPQSGEIISIEKNMATVAFGIFKTKANVKKLFKV